MMASPYRTALRLSAGTLLVYTLLVLTHLGEFWPFSIYPMFSRGGHPWVRSVVREVPPDPGAVRWQPMNTPEALPGRPYPLGPAGINQNDIANFVSKSTTWNARRIEGLRKVFGDALRERALLLFRVEGRLQDTADIQVTYTPFILLTPDTTYLNPNLEALTP